ncbi:MAG: hypothetical protein EBR79_03635 [Proteobacteria bacterium]|nr:hypothetical protein [Pseudomonadota bacterium]
MAKNWAGVKTERRVKGLRDERVNGCRVQGAGMGACGGDEARGLVGPRMAVRFLLLMDSCGPFEDGRPLLGALMLKIEGYL